MSAVGAGYVLRWSGPCFHSLNPSQFYLPGAIFPHQGTEVQGGILPAWCACLDMRDFGGNELAVPELGAV